MKTVQLPFPELLAIAATRGMLGAGAALFLSEHLDRNSRRVIGAVLLAIGLLSTPPFLYDVLRRRSSQ